MTDNTTSTALRKETIFEPRPSFTLPGKKTAPLPRKKRKKHKTDRNWKP